MKLLPDTTTAYMRYRALRGDGGWNDVSMEEVADKEVKMVELWVVDIFGMFSDAYHFISLTIIGSVKTNITYAASDGCLAAAIVGHGLIPSAPLSPSLAITL